MDRYCLLIADRNPRIRKFLKREFTTAGYRVKLAESGDEFLKIVYGPYHLDLVIVDPDLPGTDLAMITRKLHDRVPPLPIVVHTLDRDLQAMMPQLSLSGWVEKAGGSVESLKSMVAGMLARRRHERPE